MRATLMSDGVALAFGKPWSNKREARRFSIASWITARSRGRWLSNTILFVPGMSKISVEADSATSVGFDTMAVGFGMTVVGFGMMAVGFGMTVVGFGMTAVGFGMMVVFGPRTPLCCCDVAALLTEVMLPELVFGVITPGVVISSPDEFCDAGYELKG